MLRFTRKMEGQGFPVGRPVFKTGGMRPACPVGSTPTPFRPSPLTPICTVDYQPAASARVISPAGTARQPRVFCPAHNGE